LLNKTAKIRKTSWLNQNIRPFGEQHPESIFKSGFFSNLGNFNFDPS